MKATFVDFVLLLPSRSFFVFQQVVNGMTRAQDPLGASLPWQGMKANGK